MGPLGRIAGVLGAALIAFSAVPVEALTWIEATQAVEAEDVGAISRHIQEGRQQGLDLAPAFMILAAQQDRVALLEKLVASGIPADVLSVRGPNKGENALIHAAAKGNVRAVKWLLRNGAKAGFVGSCGPQCDGHSALVSAVTSDAPDVVRILLEAGADPNVMKRHAVQFAYMNGQVDIYEMLVAKGGREFAEHPFTREQKKKVTAPAQPASAPKSKLLSGIAQLLDSAAPSSRPRGAVAASRIALIGDGQSETLINLLTAELTGVAGVELIERQEIARIIEERNLATERTDLAQASKLGASLNADALLLVSRAQIEKEQVLEVRFVRVNPGIVLDTMILPASWDLKQLVRSIAANFPTLAQKSRRQKAAAVSLVSVRAAVLGGGGAELERFMKPLLTQRLARHPDFVLLERAAMEALGREAVADFWTARYLVTALITPTPDGGGKFTLELFLETPDGKKAGKGQGIGTLVDPLPALTAAIEGIAPLGEASPVPVKQELEAARFAAEAQIALALREPGIALAAAEAAWALGQRGTEILQTRIKATAGFLEQKQSVFSTPSSSAWGQNDPFRHPLRAVDCPGPAEWVQMSANCLQLWNEGLAAIAPNATEERADWLALFNEVEVNTERAFKMLHTAREMIEHRQALAGLARDWLRSLRVAQALAVELGDAPRELRFITPEMRFARHLFPKPEDQLAAWRKILGREFVAAQAYARAEIRSSLNLFKSVRTEASVSRPVLEYLRASAKLDDRFESIHQDPEIRRAGPRQVPLQRELLKTFEGLVPALIEDPRLISRFAGKVRAHEKWEERLVPERPLVRTQDGTDTGKLGYSDEYRMTYRRIMLTLFEKSGSIEGTEDWLRRDLFSPADLEALAPAARRWFDANRVEGLPKGASTWIATLKLDQASEATRRLVVRQSWYFEKVSETEYASLPQLLRLATYHEGAVWLPISLDSTRAYYLARVALPTLSTELLKVPASVEPDARSVAWGNVFFHRDNVYLSWAGVGTYIFNRTAQKWTANKTFVPSLHTPGIHGDLVYQPIQQNGGGLIQWNLATGETALLASARRSPGQTPLDDPRLGYRAVSVDATGDVHVDMVERQRQGEPLSPRRFAWSPTTRQWREEAAEPLAAVKARATRTPRNGFLQGLAIAEGTTGTARERLKFQWRPDDPNEKGVPLELIEPELHVSMKSEDNVNVRAFACPDGVLLETRRVSDGFWFIPRAEYDAFAAANGYDPLPLAHESSR